MTTLSLIRVNQKIMQAKALLHTDNTESLPPIHRNALMEGAAFHLVCAYQHYLREIAETYWLKNIIVLRSEMDLITAFETVNKHPAEAQELLAIRKNPHSWLVQLQNFYDSLWRVPIRATELESNNLINLVSIDTANVPTVDFFVMQGWLGELTALIARQRETSAEF